MLRRNGAYRPVECSHVGLDDLHGKLGVPRADDLVALLHLCRDARLVDGVLLQLAFTQHAPFGGNRAEVCPPLEDMTRADTVAHELFVLPAMSRRILRLRRGGAERLTAGPNLDRELRPWARLDGAPGSFVIQQLTFASAFEQRFSHERVAHEIAVSR